MTERDDLRMRWLRKVGDIMPDTIARLPIEKIRKAVMLAEIGATVVVPRESVIVASDETDSIADWDRQDDKNGNAYG